MLIPVSREITDLKSEFEGGTSFSVDWYSLLRRGGESVLDNLNPETLKRTVPIYGGLTQNLQVYFCPADVEVPERLYSRNSTTWLDYVPPAEFYGRSPSSNTFTIESINGARFIVTRHAVSGTILNLDPMDGTSLNTLSGVSLTRNAYNALPAAAASMQGTFSDTAYTVTIALAAAIDISNLLQGVMVLPVYLDTAASLAHVEVQLQTDVGNFYTVTSALNSVGDYLADGQNMVRFWLAQAVPTGTPDPTNITAIVLKLPMTTGNSQAVILGKLTIQQSNLWFLTYYSNRLFIDGTTGSWKDTPAKGDLINLNRDAAGILHYETARLVVQAATTDRKNQGESARFDGELTRKYQAYFRDHPSSAQPLSYNISPVISYGLDGLHGGAFDDFDERVGSNLPADMGARLINFVDIETPEGVFDDVNTTFILDHVPTPSNSLILTLNGQVLAYGVDYTLNGRIITFTSPPSALFAGLPFNAAYRFNV